jgi:hypothetical protein
VIGDRPHYFLTKTHKSGFLLKEKMAIAIFKKAFDYRLLREPKLLVRRLPEPLPKLLELFFLIEVEFPEFFRVFVPTPEPVDLLLLEEVLLVLEV